MLARLQQFTTLGLFASAITGAAYAASHGYPFLALAVVGLFASGHALVIAFELLLAARANRNDDFVPPAGAGRFLRAWAREVLVAPQVFCWQQPFRSELHPDRLPPSPGGQPGIVFVHGYVCNRGLWNPWLSRLHELGVPYLAVNLEPVFGPIDAYVPIIEQAVKRIEAATAARPLIVAHSMGGLAVRAWLDAYRAEDRVRHVITIGTPHKGTALAELAFTDNGRQMRLNSHWLRRLSQREPGSRYARFTCFYSHCDNIVFPASAATLPHADNRHVAGAAHLDLLRQETVFREICRCLGAA